MGMKDPAGAPLSTVSKFSSNEDQGKRPGMSSKPFPKSQRDLRPRPSNAAAWAWHQRLGGATGGGDIATVRKAPAHARVRRASRFKEEAMRMRSSGGGGDDVVLKPDAVITVSGSSLFDNYELVSVAKQLEEALTRANSSNESESQFPTAPFKLHSKSSHRKTRVSPSTLLCSSTGISVIKDKMEHVDCEAKSSYENGRRKNFSFGKLRHFSFSL